MTTEINKPNLKTEEAVMPTTASTAGVPSLPSPAELPNAEVVIYDGRCKFCKKQVSNLQRFDGKGRLAFLSLHDPEVSQSYPDLSHEQLMQQMFVITRDHRRLGGAEAFRHLTTRLPKLWVLAPLLHIPFSLPVWQFFYDLIAKYRYLIAGKTDDPCDDDACQIHYGKKQ